MLRHKRNEGFAYLKNRWIISILAILFFTYAFLTRDLMKTINCIGVDKSNPAEQYNQYSVATDQYWGEDTNLKCWEGKHAVLAFVLGVPGLSIISFGAPIYLAWFLTKNKDKHYDRVFLNTYGFVYQAYKERHVYWDAVIMLRKALIGAVVVFAYPLGGNLQVILAGVVDCLVHT